jgi:hypothetical protein
MDFMSMHNRPLLNINYPFSDGQVQVHGAMSYLNDEVMSEKEVNSFKMLLLGVSKM